MSTQMIKNVLYQSHCLGYSQRQIATASGISKAVVAKYLRLASQAGLDWSTIEPLSEVELEHRLTPSRVHGNRVLPDFGKVHRELTRKGVTLQLLWQEYQADYVDQPTLQYSQFCDRYRRYTKTLKVSMRQVHRAGEKLFVDFAGPTLELGDGTRGHLFVAAMGASHYTYARALSGQTTRDWIRGMTGALHHMRGAPEFIVPDNPRAVVAQPDRYEPRVNDSVLDFARHYDCSVLPARVRKPQDKAVVESAVQVVERWIMARLRHVRLPDLAAANRAIEPLLKALNDRPFQKLEGCRSSVFAQVDAPALRALPALRYEYAEFKSVKVNIDHHVEVDFHRYSAPYTLIGTDLIARVTTSTVELLHRGIRVALHPRKSLPSKFSTKLEHRPPSHKAHLQWTPERMIAWGMSIGLNTGTLVEGLLKRHKLAEHGYRSSLGVIALAKRYGNARLETACALAISIGLYNYRAVRDIVKPRRSPSFMNPPGRYHLLRPTLRDGKTQIGEQS